MSNRLRRGWRKLLQQQRWAVAVESELASPILLAAGALVADTVTVELDREHLE